MKRKSKSSTYGVLILVVLMAFIILFWPRPAAEEGPREQATADPEQMNLTPAMSDDDKQFLATLEAQAQLTIEAMAPAPSATPAPPLVLRQAHVVVSGETVQSIAAQHNTSIVLLAIYLTVDELTPGNTIQVPVPNPAVCPSGKVHVVEEHQTLYGLGRLYDSSVAEIMMLNGLATDLIKIGDLLCIP